MFDISNHGCCCCSAPKSHPTLWDPVQYSMPGSSVPPLAPGVCINSCPLSWWCYPTISSSAAPFFCLLSFLVFQVFFSELAFCIRWPKYWSFSFSITPSNEYLGLISFRIDWLDLLVVPGTVNSLLTDLISLLYKGLSIVFSRLQFKSISSSAPNHDYWKNYSTDYMDFVSKVMSLLFNTLSRFVMTFFSRSKHI